MHRSRIFIIAFIFTLTTSQSAALAAGSTTAVVGVHTFTDRSALAEGQWVKVALNNTTDGIYQITYSQLRSWGFTNPEQVGVYGFGGHAIDESFATDHIDDLPEVAVLHDAARQRILFYGRGLVSWTWRSSTYRYVQRQNTYSTQATYFLHQKEEAPLAMEVLSAGTPDVTQKNVRAYDERLLHEVDEVNVGRTGREWYGESMLYNQSLSFNFDIEGMVDSTALVSVNAIANASGATTMQVIAKSNNESRTVGKGTISSPANSYYTACETTVNSSTTVKGSTLTVNVTHNRNNNTVTKAYLNFVRVQFNRKLAFYGNDYNLFRRHATTQQSFLIEDYDSTRMEVWDVTSPHAVARQQVTGGAFQSPDASTHEYALVRTDGSFEGVSLVGTVTNQDLHGMETPQLVIIAPTTHLEQAERLAAYRREHDSLTVAVVTPTQIYNEFSSGSPDVTAYRLLMKMFYDRSATDREHGLRYLLLFGDGTYNNRTAGAGNNMLLTYQSDASLIETSSQVCDDYFGFLDDTEGGKRDNSFRYTINSDALDIGIGRLPVSSAAQGKTVVDKIISYSDNTYYGSWKNRLCFLADDDKISATVSDSPNAHMSHADQMVALLQGKGYDEFAYQKIYLAAYNQTTVASGTDYPDAKKEFRDALKQGLFLVNYSGHGNTTSITDEGIMNTSTASELSMKYLPLWITATCDFSRYDDDDTSCGETLLLNSSGGAIALISTSRVVYASENLLINRGIINRLFDRNEFGKQARLGDIVREAKVDLGSNTNKLNFCLLGDPTLSLTVPQSELRLDSINGRALQAGDTITLPALSRVTMSGYVQGADSLSVDTAFNGLVYPTIYDAAETVTADKGQHQDPVFSFETQQRKIFSGREVVRNGRFTFSFIVPQDLLYSTKSGLVNLYACDPDGNEGKGSFRAFRLNGLNSEHAVDSIGPEIRSWNLDGIADTLGGTVGITPYFSAEIHDESGFNTTGNGIGHDMALTIQSETDPLMATQQYFLNDYFTGNTGDPTTGHVRFSVPELDEGSYKASFRVSDVYNNTSSIEFRFTVNANARPEAALVQAYPNPAQVDGTVTFRILHNKPESATSMRVQVYTQGGVKVWEGTASSNSADVVYTADGARPDQIESDFGSDELNTAYGSSTMQWNCSGVAPGLYIYRAYISAGGTSEASKSKLLLMQGSSNKSE
jgi:hypothetical protein